MKKQPDLLEKHLLVVRNLTVSAYGSLLNGSTLRDELTDKIVANQLNSLVFKTKRRFDSFKVLVQTIPAGTKSDGAIALAESMLVHVSMIYDLLIDAEFEKLSAPYLNVCEPIIAEYFPADLESFMNDPEHDSGKLSMKLPGFLKSLAPAAVVYWLCVKLAAQYASKIEMKHADGLARIIREITFPPECQQAGISILNYFATVLNDKYPDIPVTVSIQQGPNLVTLVITLPDGSQDKVTKTLNDYGLVVTGMMSPKSLLNDDIKVLALQQKLELAQMEIRQTRDLLRIQDQYASKRVESLETEVKNLYLLIGREFTSRDKLQEGLLQLTTQLSTGHMGEHVASLMNMLAEAISERNEERTKIILEDIHSSQPALFERLNEFFLKAATSGVIGNYVYDWLKVLWPILPK